jgi:NADH:ubiquinone oxidoreductase subunit 6 (subunit J)
MAAIVVAGALAVVILRNVFRASLALIVCFLAVAGIYFTLSADFLAAAQILIYVGGISVLIIIAIMLTREFQHGNPSNRLRTPAVIAGIVFLGVITYSLLNTNWSVSSKTPILPTTSSLATLLFGPGGYILPVEIAAVLLLAAIIGAIVLVREK